MVQCDQEEVNLRVFSKVQGGIYKLGEKTSTVCPHTQKSVKRRSHAFINSALKLLHNAVCQYDVPARSRLA